jgi:hypothetical protein
VGNRQILRHVGESKTGERGIEDPEDIIGDKLAFDAHLQSATSSLKLPRVQAAMHGKTLIDARMADQILRSLRYRPFGEVELRANHVKRISGPTRTAIMPLATCSLPNLTGRACPLLP